MFFYIFITRVLSMPNQYITELKLILRQKWIHCMYLAEKKIECRKSNKLKKILQSGAMFNIISR